jgi:hypothetical protein
MLTASLPAMSALFRVAKSGSNKVRFRETPDMENMKEDTWARHVQSDATTKPGRSVQLYTSSGLPNARITTRISAVKPTEGPYWISTDSSQNSPPDYEGTDYYSKDKKDYSSDSDLIFGYPPSTVASDRDLGSEADSLALPIQYPQSSVVSGGRPMTAISEADTVSSGPPHPYYSNKRDLYQRL